MLCNVYETIDDFWWLLMRLIKKYMYAQFLNKVIQYNLVWGSL